MYYFYLLSPRDKCELNFFPSIFHPFLAALQMRRFLVIFTDFPRTHGNNGKKNEKLVSNDDDDDDYYYDDNNTGSLWRANSAPRVRIGIKDTPGQPTPEREPRAHDALPPPAGGLLTLHLPRARAPTA